MADVDHPNSLSKLGNQEKDPLDLDKLISSLPKERGLASLSPELVLYRNFWCPSAVFHGAHSFSHRFMANASDIILASKPKSGTTWLKALAFSTLHRSVFPPSSSNHPVTSSNPHELVHSFEYTIYGRDGELLDMASFPAPRLFHTHIPHDSLPESVHQSTCRVITTHIYNKLFIITK